MANEPERRLAQSVELGTLNACYGGLLTDRQRTALRLHCDEDFSLAEIADELGVTRQNVHELIARSEQKLRRYEGTLHLAAQTQSVRTLAANALAALECGEQAACRTALQQILNELDGEEDEPDGI